MTIDWKTYNVKDVADFLNGYPFKSKELSQDTSGVPVIKMGNLAVGGGVNLSIFKSYFTGPLTDKIKKSFAKKYDLLMCMTDMKASMNLLGYSGQVMESDLYLVNQRVGILRPKNNDILDNRFFYYVMNSAPVVDYLQQHANSGVQVNLTADSIKNTPIVLPPLATQKQIAAILGKIDEKINTHTAINNNLEQQAQALLARYNTDVQTRCKLGDLLRFVNGFAFKSSEYLANGIYKVITIKNVQDGKVDSQSASCIDELPAKMPTECTLKIGDVLLSLTGNVGRVGIVCEENLLLNQRVAKVCAKNPAYNAFLYFVMRQSQLKTEMENISRGTAQQNLSPVEALNLEINFNEEMTNKLSGVLKSYFDEIIRNTVESSHLAAIRDALLPKLMSGEIDVSKVDISDPSYLDKLLFSEETE